MKIELTNPCTVSKSELVQNNNGDFCKSCRKQVIDYTKMSDSQIFKSINNNGLGCGKFREEQLNRAIEYKIKNKSLLLYIPILALFFAKPITAKAQSKQDTIQTSHKAEINQINDKPEQVKSNEITEVIIVDNKYTEIRFGTGNISGISEGRIKRFFKRIFIKRVH